MISEDEFRALLLPDGSLGGSLEMASENAFLIFSQSSKVDVSENTWNTHAARFFQASLGLASPRNSHLLAVPDALRLVVRESEARASIRTVLLRQKTPQDVERAMNAIAPGGGIHDMVDRCPVVWLVESLGDNDRASLLVAAVFASIYLGPIVAPSGEKIFGVRTARERLERL